MDAFSIFNALGKFSESVNKPPVSLLEERCVHKQHNQATCDRCISACPTHAFELADGQMTLVAEDCVRCGYCVHACPTGAIVGQTESDKLLKRVAQHTDTSRLELACAYRSTPKIMADPQATLFVAPRCLAALSLSTYVELANQGVTHLSVRGDACADCPIGQLAAQIQETAANAQQLTASHPVMTIDVITELPADSPPVRSIQDTNQHRVSRRGLFQMFTQVNETQAAESHESAYPPTLPPEHQRLLTALESRPDAPSTWASSLTVDGDCSACQVCVRICPTRALVMEVGRKTFRLSLDAAYCTGCGLCTAGCPENVLYVDTQAEPDTTAMTMLTVGEIRECKRCKTIFSGGSDLCPACAFRRKNPFGSRMLVNMEG